MQEREAQRVKWEVEERRRKLGRWLPRAAGGILASVPGVQGSWMISPGTEYEAEVRLAPFLSLLYVASSVPRRCASSRTAWTPLTFSPFSLPRPQIIRLRRERITSFPSLHSHLLAAAKLDLALAAAQSDANSARERTKLAGGLTSAGSGGLSSGY